jgi:GrpB-like predicted nucleotidyltransferase (UPF0157 family)
VLGLPHGQNYLVDYSDAWPRLFQEEKARIEAVVGERICATAHVGSTAVPGIKAKPIIDIAIAVARLVVADELAPAMATIGYDYPGDIGIPDHRIFGRDREARRFLVHVLEQNGYRWRELIAFRDIIRANRALAREYERVKIDAVARHRTGRAQYTESKAHFVQRLLQEGGAT